MNSLKLMIWTTSPGLPVEVSKNWPVGGDAAEPQLRTAGWLPTNRAMNFWLGGVVPSPKARKQTGGTGGFNSSKISRTRPSVMSVSYEEALTGAGCAG